MVRLIAFFVGIGFAGVLAISLIFTVLGLATDPAPKTLTGAPRSAETDFYLHPRDAELSSAGMMGKFDKRQLQRGFQVYKEVCAACHSLKYVAFRDLKDIGYDKKGQVEAIAAMFENIPTINPDTGEAALRKGKPADRFPLPFPNNEAARAANNNAIPPDLSYMTRARHEGPDYVYSLLTGYKNQVGYKNDKGEELLKVYPDAKTPTGLHFNPYFANLNIAMPPPLTSNGQIQYLDGTPSTVDNYAKDVAAFLVWTADPSLETRHTAGFASVIFLLLASIMAFGAYRNVWRNVKH